MIVVVVGVGVGVGAAGCCSRSSSSRSGSSSNSSSSSSSNEAFPLVSKSISWYWAGVPGIPVHYKLVLIENSRTPQPGMRTNGKVSYT